MGTWYPPDEMHEQWEEFQRRHWKAGHPLPLEEYNAVKDSWDNGYINGYKEIKDE